MQAKLASRRESALSHVVEYCIVQKEAVAVLLSKKTLFRTNYFVSMKVVEQAKTLTRKATLRNLNGINSINS